MTHQVSEADARETLSRLIYTYHDYEAALGYAAYARTLHPRITEQIVRDAIRKDIEIRANEAARVRINPAIYPPSDDGGIVGRIFDAPFDMADWFFGD